MFSGKKFGLPESLIKAVAEATKTHTVPKTEKEKKLAALAEPKDKITHKDVMVGRGVIAKPLSNNPSAEKTYNYAFDKVRSMDAKNPFKISNKKSMYTRAARGAFQRMQTSSKKPSLPEEVEQLSELDKEPGGTLHRYLTKAGGPEGRQRRLKAAMDNPAKLKKINTGIKSAETKIEKERQKQTGMNPQYRRTPTAREIQMMDTRYTHEEYESMPADMKKEEVEQIDELKKSTLTSYANKAGQRAAKSLDSGKIDAVIDGGSSWAWDNRSLEKNRPTTNRLRGMYRARQRLNKEEVELEEAQYGVNLGSRPVSGQKEYQGKEIKSFHPNKEKEAREYAKKHGYVVKKKELPKGNNITHTWDIHKEEVVTEMDKSQPSSSRGAEGLPVGKKAEPVKTNKVKTDALKVLQKQYKKVKEEKDTPGNSYEHQCALHVKHAKLGEGKTLFSQHAEPSKDGTIDWYDVMFEHGIEKKVPTTDLEVLVSESHMNHKKKGK